MQVLSIRCPLEPEVICSVSLQPPATAPGAVLSSTQLDAFLRTGYLVLPGFLSAALLERLRPEVDRWVDEGLRAQSIACCLEENRGQLPPLLELEMPAHAELLALPALLQVLVDLLGPSFVFHHLHSDRHEPGVAGKAWHHDCETNSRNDPDLLMVHALHYLEGLDESVGSLVVLPGSHTERVAKAARPIWHRCHPGRGGDRPPAARFDRAAALGALPRPPPVVVRDLGAGRRRYFVDASYCQTGALWRPVKPYWRYMLARAVTCSWTADSGRTSLPNAISPSTAGTDGRWRSRRS